MMEMTSNHIPITQLHVSHFFVLEPPILPQSYATRITTCVGKGGKLGRPLHMDITFHILPWEAP